MVPPPPPVPLLPLLSLPQRLVEVTPLLRDLFPSGSDREMLLVYAYLLLGAVMARLVVRNVAYA